MKASSTFHHPDFKHNCAQAVANKWRHLYSTPDTIVPLMQANGGGRAADGLCGALYAAIEACPQHADEIKRLFEERAGALTCKAIKGEAKTPCPTCVDIADEILEQINNQ